MRTLRPFVDEGMDRGQINAPSIYISTPAAFIKVHNYNLYVEYSSLAGVRSVIGHVPAQLA